ncbi:MAG: hypothetical protein M3N08_09655 [Pseudomonadota bacterium]|nr:hypothetical protein [Pseudomonadota bacterium]
MADGSSQNLSPEGGDPADRVRMQTLLVAFRQVGMPLLHALAEGPRNAEGGKSMAIDNQQFGSLVDSTVALSHELAQQLGANEDQLDAWVRWALAGAASQTVAARFKATGEALPLEDAKRLASIAIELQNRFKAQIPAGNEPIPNTAATFRAKTMEAMVPAIGAVAQYSFGRAEHVLLAEVAGRLVNTSDQVTRALAPSGCSAEEWRLLCWNVLRAAGQIYAESHYAEADRLLYMNADERGAYFAQHGNIPPMTQVWQAFHQRMAMLATLATYLDVPASAQLDAEGWV